MYRLFFFIVFTTYLGTMDAQVQIVDYSLEPVFSTTDKDRSEFLLGDIDSDGALDSLYYSFKDESVKVILSSKKDEVLSIDYPIYTSFSIDVKENILYIDHIQMRYTEIFSYMFDTVKRDYQLVYSSSESYSTVTNDGLSRREFDFRTGAYTDNCFYFNNELDSLISLPSINLVIPLPPIYLGDTILSEYISDDFFSYYKKRHMLEERLKNISVESILNLKTCSIPTSIEIETTSIDSLFSNYGQDMGYDSDLKFSYRNLIEHNNYDYISSIIPLSITPKMVVYFVSFSFFTSTYFVCYLDREILENRYVEYSGNKNIELSKMILEKLPNNYYPIRDTQYE